MHRRDLQSLGRAVQHQVKQQSAHVVAETIHVIECTHTTPAVPGGEGARASLLQLGTWLNPSQAHTASQIASRFSIARTACIKQHMKLLAEEACGSRFNQTLPHAHCGSPEEFQWMGRAVLDRRASEEPKWVLVGVL